MPHVPGANQVRRKSSDGSVDAQGASASRLAAGHRLAFHTGQAVRATFDHVVRFRTGHRSSIGIFQIVALADLFALDLRVYRGIQAHYRLAGNMRFASYSVQYLFTP